MSCATRFPAVRSLAACAILVCGVLVVSGSAAKAQEGKTPIKLVFSLPEGAVLRYESFNQLGRNFGGMDVSMNQTSKVEMAYAGGADSTGASRVDLKYIEVKTSLVSGGRIQDWSPPIKLEGATIKVTIMPNGDIVKFDPGRKIPGLSSPDDLIEIVNAWFVKFPEEEIAPGQSWTEKVELGKRSDGGFGTTGEIVFTFKKVEKKDGIDVAVIEGKMKLKLNQEEVEGTLVGEGKGDLKAKVALNGGYIVELKESIDVKGDVVVKDPLTDKVTKSEMVLTQIYERKLQN